VASLGSPVVDCTHLRVRKLSRAISRLYDAEMAGIGLRMTQFSLLACVERLGPVSPSALAEAMTMDASTLTRNLRPLLARRWAAQESGQDARQRIVTLTELGAATLLSARGRWRRAQKHVRAVLGDADLTTLNSLIDRIQDKLAGGT